MPGLVVELGSGMGHIKEHLPDCITTDLFPNEWLDRVEDAYHLTFDTGAVSHLILFDVWHHLAYPGTALGEFHRVLVDRGKVIIFDPAMGVLGRFVFGNFHDAKKYVQFQTKHSQHCTNGDSVCHDLAPTKLQGQFFKGNIKKIRLIVYLCG